MKIPYFEVLAFTNRLFSGNPAGVCLLHDQWLPDELMQKIAAENNLAETAFLIDRGDYFDLRWMTPTIEMDLCGHATLASGHVLFSHLNYPVDVIRFHSMSGELTVSRQDGRLALDFPAQPLPPCPVSPQMIAALGASPSAVFKGRDYLAVFESEEEVASIAPDFALLAALDAQGVVVTAPGSDVDFVSRYFGPAVGIPEDPVTGSTHCALVPYWSKRLGKNQLHARQISKRGGELFCEDRGKRVTIAGEAITYSEGHLHVAG